jgi:hypothetical protein
MEPAVLQVAELRELVGLSWTARVFVGFAVFTGGSFVLSRREPGLVDRAISSTTARPVLSGLSGLLAQAVLLLATAYLFSQIWQVSIAGVSIGFGAAGLGLLGLLGIAVLGLTVVATALVGVVKESADELVWPTTGLIGAGILGAPTVYSAILWVIVVSLGVGGLVRRWLTDAE